MSTERCPVCSRPIRAHEPALVEWAPLEVTHQGHDERGRFTEYANDRYGVVHRRSGGQEWLMISRLDGSAERDWRDFQRIKSEVFGPEVEAVELYPAESRVIDPSNAYFLWRLRGDARRIGLPGPRFVAEPGVTGAPQRRLTA